LEKKKKEAEQKKQQAERIDRRLVNFEFKFSNKFIYFLKNKK
jgi:hypothetical protein